MSRRLEIGALLGLCVFLPLYEAPKSIFWALYLLVWLVNRVRARDFGGRWDAWDSVIAAWIASGFAVAAFAGLRGDEWRGAADLFRVATVLWVVKRSRYDEREVRWVLAALIAATAYGVVQGVWKWATRVESLQLNSVGHVNHTAVYLAMILLVCAAWALESRRLTLIAAAAFTLLALFLTASRAAILATFGTLVVVGGAYWRRARAALAIVIAVIVATAAAAWLGNAEVVRKQEAFAGQNDVLARRDAVWHLAIVAWRQYPWAGVGIDNYGRITRDNYRAWRLAQGETYDPRLYAQYSHGHSLYLNTLAERGVLGAIPLAVLLLAWFVALWRGRPQPQAASQEWLLWSGAAGAFLVTIVVGLANTTLHHEHGILAVLLLGLWLSKRPAR